MELDKEAVEKRRQYEKDMFDMTPEGRKRYELDLEEQNPELKERRLHNEKIIADQHQKDLER